jgi:ProQ/FINO family
MRPSREESEAVVRMLVEKYPSAFFEDPRLRRPLKNDILRDLQEDGFPVARELMVAGVDWYMSHFGYQLALQAGARRLDLDGKEVSTVTEQECLNARKKVRDDRQRLNDWNNGTLAPRVLPELTRLHEAFVAANRTLSGTSDAGLRLAMTSAALGVVVKEAQRLIDTTMGDDR